jgi:UDPglucose 6-dehydrogenase
MRSAASLTVIEMLQNEGANIQVYDPQAMPNAKKMMKGIIFCADPYAAAKGADCLLLLTEWDEFRKVNLAKARELMRQAVVFDGRNFFNSKALGDLGFEYYGIGRGGNA